LVNFPACRLQARRSPEFAASTCRRLNRKKRQILPRRSAALDFSRVHARPPNVSSDAESFTVPSNAASNRRSSVPRIRRDLAASREPSKATSKPTALACFNEKPFHPLRISSSRPFFHLQTPRRTDVQASRAFVAT
ncbi:MAG: hypothetical protein IJY15_04675, partial [Thermoguttaceae bacterium]|nr:hypothetical protein [Thermoguttaceae bacterium]